MTNISSMIVRNRLPLTFGIVGAVIFAAALAVYLMSIRVNRASHDCTRAMQVELALDDTRYLIGRAETGYRTYLLTGERHHLKDYQDAAGRLPEKLALLAEAVQQGEAPSEQIDLLTRRINVKLADFSRNISLRTAQSPQVAETRALSMEEERSIDDIRNQFDVIRPVMEAEYIRRDQARNLAVIMRIVVSVASAAVSLAFLGWAYRTIRRTMRALEEERRKQQENEARLHAIFHKAALGIVLIDRDDRIIESNDRFCQMLDSTCQELRGQNIHELTVPEDRAQSRRLNVDLREGRLEHLVYEKRYRKRDGTPVWVRVAINGLRDETGGWLGAIGTVEDIAERKRAEELLKLRESYLRSIIENQPGLIWLKDEKGRFLAVNTAFAASCGMKSPEDLVGKTDLDIWPKELAEKYQVDDARVIQGGRPLSVEEPIFDRRQTKWFETFKTPIYDETGKVIGTTGYARDVTERKAAEVALRDSEARLKRVIAATKLGSWDHNLVTGELLWDARCKEIFGIAPEMSVSFDTFFAILHPQDQERVRQAVQAAQAPGSSGDFDIENRIIGLTNGVVRWVHATGQALFNQEGRAIRFTGTVEDVTERKRAEEDLRASEERFRNLAEAMPQLVWIARADGFVYWYNRRWYEFTGTTPAQMEGWGWQSVIDPVYLPQVVERWKHSLATCEPFEMTFPIRDAYGQFGVFLSRAIPIKDEQGRVVQWFGTSTDVTELEHTKAALARARDELARSNQELEQFAYAASHDLQEPLRMISSYLQLLDQRYREKLDQSAHDFIGFAVDGATRMSQLIKDLLQYSRIGTQGKEPEPVALAEVLEKAKGNLQLAIAEASAEVQVGPLPTVRGDPVQLVQLFQNLIGNAIKFRAPGHSVRVCVGAELTGEKGQWRINITDSGIGIAPEHREKIFQVFKRLHTRQEYPGTGIGLAICKKIVERHGGHIWVDSQLGHGSTFHFTLPAA
jgi:PAS domain S-box-containing protein